MSPTPIYLVGHLPWFGGHVAAVLRGWALTHHCGHANLKVFGDILDVGLSEAHSTCQQNELRHCMLYLKCIPPELKYIIDTEIVWIIVC